MSAMRIFQSQSRLLFYTFIACLACLLASRMVMASEGQNMEQVISVSGSAEASVEPDLVAVRFGVETQEKSSQAALASNANLMQSVTDALMSAGIEEDEISTSRFNIHAVYESVQERQGGPRRQVLTGYRVSNILTVETPRLDMVAGIIDSAVEAGVNRVDGVNFMLSQPVLSKLKRDLIELAVLNARDKAELALSPLEHEISGVKSISLTENMPTPMMMSDAPRMEMARSAPTQIFSSDQDVRTSVQVTFLIRDKASDECQEEED